MSHTADIKTLSGEKVFGVRKQTVRFRYLKEEDNLNSAYDRFIVHIIVFLCVHIIDLLCI